MLNKFALAAAALLISTGAALAASPCDEPYAPAAMDGSKATEAQMKGAHDDVMTFMKASDDYQSCLLDDLKNQQQTAAKAKDPKPLDQSIVDGVNKKIDANQRMKEKVGGEYNAAVQAYKAAHK
jgi:hypothetical protein